MTRGSTWTACTAIVMSRCKQIQARGGWEHTVPRLDLSVTRILSLSSQPVNFIFVREAKQLSHLK